MATRRSQPARRASAHKQVVLMINGQSTGLHTPVAGDTIRAIADKIASSNGVKSYSILANGIKVQTDTDASKGLAGVHTLEIFAKETRG